MSFISCSNSPCRSLCLVGPCLQSVRCLCPNVYVKASQYALSRHLLLDRLALDPFQMQLSRLLLLFPPVSRKAPTIDRYANERAGPIFMS